VRQHPEPAQFDIFLKMNSGMNRLGFQPQHTAKYGSHFDLATQ
jgi:alanine racemase